MSTSNDLMSQEDYRFDFCTMAQEDDAGILRFPFMEEMHSEASERDSYIHPQPFPSPMDLSELERQTYFQAAFRTPGQGPHDSIHTAYFVPHPDFKVATPMEYIRSPSPSNTVSSTDPSDTTFIESDNGCEEDFAARTSYPSPPPGSPPRRANGTQLRAGSASRAAQRIQDTGLAPGDTSLEVARYIVQPMQSFLATYYPGTILDAPFVSLGVKGRCGLCSKPQAALPRHIGTEIRNAAGKFKSSSATMSGPKRVLWLHAFVHLVNACGEATSTDLRNEMDVFLEEFPLWGGTAVPEQARFPNMWTRAQVWAERLWAAERCDDCGMTFSRSGSKSRHGPRCPGPQAPTS